MTQATLVGSVAIVFGAAPVSAQHRHVSGRGQISGHVGVGSMHSINRTGRYAVPRATLPPRVTTINSYRPIYHRPGVATPGHVWVNRYDHAEVYVDGYYAGTVDDFDGRYQELQLEPGQHVIEVRAPGYEPLSFDVNIQRGRNIVYHQTLQPARR